MSRKRLLNVQFLFVLLCGTGLLFAPSSSNAQSDRVMFKQWGEFGEAPGQFKYPAMITVDNSGNIYVVDQHNHRIQKFNSQGEFILMWGKYGNEPG